MRKKGIIAILMVIGIVLVLYVLGILMFWNKALPNTYLGKIDISRMNSEEIQSLIDNRYNKQIKIATSEFEYKSIVLNNVKSNNYADNTGNVIISEQRSDIYMWPVLLFKEKNVSANETLQINEEKLNQAIDALALNDNCIMPENAEVQISDTGEPYIEPEVEGNEIDIDKLKSLVWEKINKNKELVINGEDIPYIRPEITKESDELKNEIKELENKINRKIVLDLTDATEEILFKDLIDTDAFISDRSISVNEDKLYNIILELKEEYDTYGTSRKFQTHSGEWINVGGNYDGASDTYGFSMDTEATYDEIVAALEECDNDEISVSVVWDISANARDENGDIGDTYIEISLDEQHLWYWVNGELYLDTPIVTGLPTASRHTPTGVFGIFSKGTDINLIGTMDGESWNSFVNYWMSVTWTEVGIHDAPWRGTDPSGYGGNIYTYNGSHGCINLPYSAEETLYYETDMGTCVVIY